MARTVYIVGMIEPYKGGLGDGDGDEVWCVNRAYRNQKNVSRVYFFDSPGHFVPEFIEDMNKGDWRVIGRKAWPEIPKCEEFPLQDLRDYFNGALDSYFTCTVAYMIATAIAEGFEKIHLHGMYHLGDSMEYWLHIPCVNFWTGVALGLKRKVEVDHNCMVVKPYPWQPGLYGYTVQHSEGLATRIMASAYQACLFFPVNYETAEDAEVTAAKELADLEKEKEDGCTTDTTLVHTIGG